MENLSTRKTYLSKINYMTKKISIETQFGNILELYCHNVVISTMSISLFVGEDMIGHFKEPKGYYIEEYKEKPGNIRPNNILLNH